MPISRDDGDTGLVGPRGDDRLEMGLVVRQTFGVIARNAGPIVLIALIVAIASSILSLGVGRLISGWRLPYGTGGSAGLDGIIAATLQPLGVAAITQITIGDLGGRQASLGAAIRTGLRLMLPLLALGLAIAIGIIVGLVVLIVPGVLLTLRWLVATPVRVAEGPSVSRALQRSAELTAGSRWRLLGLTAAYFTMAVIMYAAFGLLAEALVRAMGDRSLIDSAVDIVTGTIQTIISSTGVAVCYVKLRELREGATPNDLAAVFA